MYFKDRERARGMTALWERIVSAGNRCDGCDLLAQCAASQAIDHAAAQREAGSINALCINAVILFEQGEQIAGELHIISVTCWTISAVASIPRGGIIDTLWQDQNEICLISLLIHAGRAHHDK